MTWREDVAWAAGLFDGEGNFYLRPEKQYRGVMLQVGQADTRVLERFRDVFDRGQITGPVKAGRRFKPTAYWVYRAATWDSQAIASMMWPFLSPVKRDQIRHALSIRKDYLRAKPQREATKRLICRNGHEVARVGGRTSRGLCCQCGRDSSTRYRDRTKPGRTLRPGKQWRPHVFVGGDLV